MSDFEMVYEALRQAAKERETITTDDVWEFLSFTPAERNTVGKAFSEAKRKGVIEGTERFVQSKRVEAKGRRVQVWTSLIHGSGQPALGGLWGE